MDTVLGRRTTGGSDDVVSRLLAGESEDRLTQQELFATLCYCSSPVIYANNFNVRLLHSLPVAAS